MNKFPLTLLPAVCMLFWLVVAEAQSLRVTEVAPGIYVHVGRQQLPDRKNMGAIANIGFIIGQRCVAVIDSGGNPEEGRALRRAIRNVTAVPVCYVINSHVHPDHIFGNSAFRSPGVKFVGHYKLPRAMAMRGPYYLEKAGRQWGLQLTERDIIPPDLTVKKHITLDLGGRKLQLTAYGTGHTDNDLSVYDDRTNTMWLADLLFIGHLPVIDGSLKGWLQELRQLQQRQFAVVIPGHGPVVRDWPAALQPELDYLEMLLRETRAAVKKGVHLQDAVQSIGLSARGHWQLYNQFHRKNVTTAFAELEWEE